MSGDTIWGKKQHVGPSAGLVQQHYVEARKEALYRRNKDLEAQVAKALREHPLLKSMNLKGDNWIPVYKKINVALQERPLTINFTAASWFTTENKYPGYTQVYERSGRNDSDPKHAQLLDNNLNPAMDRSRIDDEITFKNLAGAPATPAPAHRGLMPGRQGLDRIRTQMEFRPASKVRVVVDPADKKKRSVYADSTNPHFNPKTKQVFAALNYGRRLLGSCTRYGKSHLVLKPKFKLNALYYGGDTFGHGDGSKQAAFHVVGSLIAWAKEPLLTDIIKSCYFDTRLPDTDSAALLLEAHLFTELSFSGNIEEVVIDAAMGTVQHDNARLFAKKHGAKLVTV